MGAVGVLVRLRFGAGIGMAEGTGAVPWVEQWMGLVMVADDHKWLVVGSDG